MTQKKKSGKIDTRVVIKRCEEYNINEIKRLIQEGMDELGYKPEGKVFVKPNVVYATKNGKYGSTAYTDPAIVEGALSLLGNAPGVSRVDMGEKTAIGYPTRMNYKYAGYYKLVRRVKKQAPVPVNIFCIDEYPREKVFIGGSIHDNIRIARPMSKADTLFFLPKLKSHCVSNMTGAVKLNIGSISDDERAIRHDFLLNEKIVDLLKAGYPDFTVMDAIDVGVGNEAVPSPRRLGVLIMSRNPLAADLVGAKLLGYNLKDVPYLEAAVKRGYGPSALKDVTLLGDITTLAGINKQAKRLLPYDDEFYKWQDVEKELKRLESPIRYYWGYTNERTGDKCLTGCVMGIKMFFGFINRYIGDEAFKKGKPVVLVIGKIDEEIDAKGAEAFLIGSCSGANIINAKKITKIDSCFTTAVEMTQTIRGRLGLPTPLYAPSLVLPLTKNMIIALFVKIIRGRYLQDFKTFLKHGLMKKI